MKGRLHNGKLRYHAERFRGQERHWLRHWVESPIGSNQIWWIPTGNLSASTRASPLVNVFIPSTHVIYQTLRAILKRLPDSKTCTVRRVLWARAKHVPTTSTYSDSVSSLNTGPQDPVSYAQLSYSQSSSIILYQRYEHNGVQSPKLFANFLSPTAMLPTRRGILTPQMHQTMPKPKPNAYSTQCHSPTVEQLLSDLPSRFRKSTIRQTMSRLT